MFEVKYEIEFVSGILQGLKSNMRLPYPLSSLSRVETDFDADVKSARVITGIGGSKYKILGFQIAYI